MYRYWVNGSVIYSKIAAAGAPEDRIREWLSETGVHLRWWDTLMIYPSTSGFSDVYIRSSILEKLYNDRADDPAPPRKARRQSK